MQFLSSSMPEKNRLCELRTVPTVPYRSSVLSEPSAEMSGRLSSCGLTTWNKTDSGRNSTLEALASLHAALGSLSCEPGRGARFNFIDPRLPSLPLDLRSKRDASAAVRLCTCTPGIAQCTAPVTRCKALGADDDVAKRKAKTAGPIGWSPTEVRTVLKRGGLSVLFTAPRCIPAGKFGLATPAELKRRNSCRA